MAERKRNATGVEQLKCHPLEDIVLPGRRGLRWTTIVG